MSLSDMAKAKIPTTQKNSRMRCFYGITEETRQRMIVEQGNRCEICRRVFNSDKGTEPHTEHDHDSGWVRGIVCENCNFGLGAFHDDIDVMQRAIEYLIENATPTEFNIGEARARLRKPPNKPHGEHAEKLKILMTGNTHRTGYPAWNKDKAWSEETRKKMSDSANRRWQSKEQRAAAAIAGAKGAEKRWGKIG